MERNITFLNQIKVCQVFGDGGEVISKLVIENSSSCGNKSGIFNALSKVGSFAA